MWIVLSLACSRAATPGEPPLRVLFVGNSYTAILGSVPDLVARMAEAAGESRPLDFGLVAPGGYTLEDHWSNSAGTLDQIAAGGPWDLVVLQEQSLRPIQDPELFETHAGLLDGAIRDAGAETVLYLTWAREFAPETQVDLTVAYCGVGARLGARVIPVGLAWQLSLETDSSVTLHQEDGSHQNARGMYLTGLVFYRALYGGDPVGLPHDLSSNVEVTEEEAAYLQTIARDAPECAYSVFADGFESGDTTVWAA